MKHRDDIDGLRAIAIVLTLMFHLFPSLLPGGFVGVDVFFVISGYLITGILAEALDRGTFSIGGFYARRIIRLLPSLLTVLLAVLVIGWLALFANELLDLGKQVVAAGLFSSNILLILTTNYFNPDAQTKPLLHLWSLGVEEQFYIAYPLLLFALTKARVRPMVPLVLIAAGTFALAIAVAPMHQVQAFYSPVTRAWELLIGAILQLMHRRFPPAGRSAALTAGRLLLFGAGVAAIGAGAWSIEAGKPYPTWLALLPTIGAAAIIAVRQPSIAQSIALSNGAITYLGRISYPLYLWHWPFISVATILSAGEPALKIRLWILVLSVLLSVVTYHLIEAPIRHSRHRRFWVASLITGLVLVSSLGAAAWLTGGFPGRRAATMLPPDAFAYTFKESCYEVTKTRYGDDWCHPHTQTEPPTVLLLGDSFSAPYASALVELSKSKHFAFKQYGRGQCAPLFNYGPQPCRELLSAALSATDLSQVETVILALDWRQYINGKVYYLMPNASPESAESFARALRETVDYWLAKGKRLVIFYGPPQGANPLECVTRSFSLKKGKDCRIPRADAERNDGGYRSKLAAVLAGRTGVLFFDPFPYLCDEEYCQVKEGREFLYVDRVVQDKDASMFWNHLSEPGGELVAQRGDKEMANLLGLK